MSADRDAIKISGITGPKKTELYFCPNGNIAQILRRKDFSEEKRTAIRSLNRLDKRWNFVIVFHFALWLSAAWAATLTEVFIANLICYVIGGVALSTLTTLAHESSHNLFTHNAKIDRWIGFLCGLPALLSTVGYRTAHASHHKQVRSPADPDDIENVTNNSRLLTLLYLLMLLLGAYLYIFHIPIEAGKMASSKQRLRILLDCGIILTILISAWIFIPVNIMIEAWLMPIFIAAQILNIRGLAEHGLTSTGNELIDTRTVATHPVLAFFMCNINYHLEHHLYPGVPWYNLPKLHRLLEEEYRKAGSSIYPSYRAFLWDVFKILKRGIVPGKRLIPASARKEICL